MLLYFIYFVKNKFCIFLVESHQVPVSLNLCPVVDRRLIVPVLIPWGEILLVDVSLLVQYKLDYPRSLATQVNLVKCFILTIADLILLVLICRKLKPFTRSS